MTFRIITNPTGTFTVPPVDIVEPVPSYLHVEYTYLGQKEIDYIRKTPQIHVVEQVQLAEFSVPAVSPPVPQSVRCNLGFSNIVKELFFVIQNETALGYDFLANNTSNVQQIVNLELLFNSTERISTDVGTPLFCGSFRVLNSIPVFPVTISTCTLSASTQSPGDLQVA